MSPGTAFSRSTQRMSRTPRSLRLAFLSAVALAARAGSSQLSGPEFRVSMSADKEQSHPDVAVGSTHFVVVWDGYDRSSLGAERRGILARRYSRAGAVESADLIELGEAHHPRVAAAGESFLVVWEDTRLDDGDPVPVIGATPYRARTGRENFAYIFSNASKPAVAGDFFRGFVVVWEGNDGSDHGIFAKRYTKDFQPIDGGSVFRVNSYTTGHQAKPAVAIAPNGQFVVTWEGNLSNGDVNVYYQRFSSSGVPEGTEVRPHPDQTGYQRAPDVETAVDGSFVVTWESPDGHNDGVFARTFTSTGIPSSAEFRVNAVTTGIQISQGVTMEGGFIHLTWQDRRADGLLYEVWARRRSGNTLAAPFRVNGHQTGDQQTPRIDTEGGLFVVTWESNGLDTADAFARKICVGGDVDGNRSITVADVFYLINFLFAGGPAPA